MRLDFRERVTYVIYTEPYSYMGITREELLETARSLHRVIGAHPTGINDEIEVILFHNYTIYDFINDFKYRLDSLLDRKIRESAV